jgi:hypothetical protein
MLQPRLVYSLLTALVAVYALLLAGTVMTAKGDRKQELNLVLWGGPQIPVLVILMADRNPYGVHLKNVVQWAQILLRIVLCGGITAATICAWAFAVALWAQQGSAAGAAIPAAVFILAAQWIVGVLMTLIALAGLWVPRVLLPFLNTDDLVRLERESPIEPLLTDDGAAETEADADY